MEIKQSPLSGKRIVVTRSPEQAEGLCAPLEAMGAQCIRFPVIDFVPLPAPELDNALAQLDQYTWLIFTSANAVRFFFRRLEIGDWRLASNLQSPISNLPCIAVVGSATQQALAEKGVSVDFMPDEFTGEQLAMCLGDVAGRRILLPRARLGRPEIVALLRERGALVDDIALYETVAAVPTPEALAELEKGADVLTFTSPSSVRNFVNIVRHTMFWKHRMSALVAVIGPSTAAEAKKYGLQVDIMPREYTIEGLVTAVVEHQTSDFGNQRLLEKSDVYDPHKESL
ncbi:MAG: uroporphyrinogen-III synthase [Anaerolineae bacterium]|nr:uroporphyrinogen-III synthase [Anaerolineae bacterium]